MAKTTRTEFGESIGIEAYSELKDAGAHYRHHYKGIQLDPFRIAKIYGMTSFAMMTILKKCLCGGNRGHKDYIQDLKDIINAAEREIEIVTEDMGEQCEKL